MKRRPTSGLATRSRLGFTVLELLLAIAVLAIGLLALAFALSGTMRGVRDDARITAANQAAVAVIENARARIDADSGHALDNGETGSRDVTSEGEVFHVEWDVIPMAIDSTGGLTVTAGTPHVFEVSAQVTSPRGVTRSYSTVVARPTSTGSGGE